VDLIFRYERVIIQSCTLAVLIMCWRSQSLADIEQFNPSAHEMPEKDALVLESVEFVTERLSEFVAKADDSRECET
jgi:hypothetical protein